MSVNDDPAARECYSKKAMPENVAKQVAARKRYLRAYQCPICSMWHVTNDRKAERRKQRDRRARIANVGS